MIQPQPAHMPRPDLVPLHIKYRRIPIVAIGRSIIMDSRHFVDRVKSLPGSTHVVDDPQVTGMAKLLDIWANEGGVFGAAVTQIPDTHPFLSDEVWLDDRQSMMGWRLTRERLQGLRQSGSSKIEQALAMLENTFFADGRNWICSTPEPTVADLNGVWVWGYLGVDEMMQGALEEGWFRGNFPRVWAWVQRFLIVVRERKKEIWLGKLSGEDAKTWILNHGIDVEVSVRTNDPLSLKEGDEIEVWPMDHNDAVRDTGKLVGLTVDEVVIQNEVGLNLHFPRWHFNVRKVD